MNLKRGSPIVDGLSIAERVHEVFDCVKLLSDLELDVVKVALNG